jgi:hypothetical protein
VLRGLADKDSVKFEDVRIYKKSQTVCGLVNAKNASAAYAGFSPFVYDIKTKSASFNISEDLLRDNYLSRVCQD